MVKLSDFARLQGVTPRAIQRLVKKYESDLDGHIDRQGQNGTWLDDMAQDFIRAKMKNNPVVIYDDKDIPYYGELQAAKKENDELRKQLIAVYERLSDVQAENNQIQVKLGEQKLLAAGKEAAEEALIDARASIAVLIEKNDVLQRDNERLAEEMARAGETIDTVEKIADLNAQEADDAKREAADLRAEIDRLKRRSLWQRIMNKE